MFQLQAEHRHAAGLIDLLFKGRVSATKSKETRNKILAQVNTKDSGKR